jgi:hypothetical protein
MDTERYIANKSKALTLRTKFFLVKEPTLEEQTIILDMFSGLGFANLKFVFAYKGMVPEFEFNHYDKPLTYFEERREIADAIDIQRGKAIPEMMVLLPETVKAMRKAIEKLDIEYRRMRELIVCYWYKIPLMGVLIILPKEIDGKTHISGVRGNGPEPLHPTPQGELVELEIDLIN